ncbi:MAG: hypothetical protein ACTTKU_05420 [Eggerthia catenaformis]|nr:hypothetical protein [Eggerthia catenaformis]
MDIEHLYDIFIEIVNNVKLQQNLLYAENYSQFMNILARDIKNR